MYHVPMPVLSHLYILQYIPYLQDMDERLKTYIKLDVPGYVAMQLNLIFRFCSRVNNYITILRILYTAEAKNVPEMLGKGTLIL